MLLRSAQRRTHRNVFIQILISIHITPRKLFTIDILAEAISHHCSHQITDFRLSITSVHEHCHFHVWSTAASPFFFDMDLSVQEYLLIKYWMDLAGDTEYSHLGRIRLVEFGCSGSGSSRPSRLSSSNSWFSIERPRFQHIRCASHVDLLIRLYCTVAGFTRSRSSGSDQPNARTRIQNSQISPIECALIMYVDFF